MALMVSSVEAIESFTGVIMCRFFIDLFVVKKNYSTFVSTQRYMKNFRFTIIYLILLLLCPIRLIAQQRQTREEYIERYKAIAVAHMERYVIPASITMAQ